MAKISTALMEKIVLATRPAIGSLRAASWLLSDYDDEIWWIQLDKTKSFIDWRKGFGDGLLTDPQNRKTWDTLRGWLLFQTHPSNTNGRLLKPYTVKLRVRLVMRQIDYLLLNQDKLGIARRGLDALDANDIKVFCYAVESHASDSESIYQWTQRLTDFLKSAPEPTEEELTKLTEDIPELFHISTHSSDWSLNLTKDELIRARVYLWQQGLYKQTEKTGFSRSPSTSKLSKILYPDTIAGHYKHEIFEELCFGSVDFYRREFPAVDVRTGEKEGSLAARAANHKTAFFSLASLGNFGLSIPACMVGDIDQDKLFDTSKFKAPGRFRTLPFWTVLDGLKHAISYFDAHGEHLLASHANVFKAANDENMSVRELVATFDIREFLEPKTLELGVKGWNIQSEDDRHRMERQTKSAGSLSSAEYFTALRNNDGLIEAITVLYGGIQHSVGSMMARRQAELLRLVAGKCLDSSRTNMIFDNGKSGAGEVRARELRPIPSICVDMIELIGRHQNRLVELGVIPKRTGLFSLPGLSGLRVITSVTYNGALDTFCDYIEVPTVAGERYYFRQHQLRRFFASAFLYAASFGTMQALRWFLAQTDAEHLWHYITESTPGEMLQFAKANFLTTQLQGSLPGADMRTGVLVAQEDADALAMLTKEHFGTSEYSLIDSDALEGFLAMQLERGLSVEPFFYETPEGKRYKIAVRVQKEKAAR